MKTIGKYIIRGLLGRGGMSRVYKVEIPVIGKIAALKRLEPDPMLVHLMGIAEIRRRFIAEAVRMAGLRHPHILDIWDFNAEDDRPYYLMNYYTDNLGRMIGETYRTEAPSRVLPLDSAIQYTRQILAGLACLHHAGIIHHDIKPFNILLTDNENVKICDFGLSKLRGETFDGPPNLKVGSRYYAAPEQEADPDQVDERADLYPVGVMLYRMITGALPLPGFKAPSELNPDLDETWDDFMAKALSTDLSHRFKHARQMGLGLEALAGRWERQKEHTCSLPRVRVPARRILIPGPAGLRSQPVKVNPSRAEHLFAVDNLWRPRGHVANDFDSEQAETVVDRSTGLLWQRSGSTYPLTWKKGHDYINGLNAANLAGRSDWRLPTVDELMSLLSRLPQGGDYCLESPFDRRQSSFWSADRRSFTAAWYVSVGLGFVSWRDMTGFAHVKGVCSL